MKKTIKNALLAILAAFSLNCCGREVYPQYSGRYNLVSSSCSKNFEGEKTIPKELNITDRMDYYGGQWNHYLKLEFVPETQDEASGVMTLKLEDLTRIDKGVYPNNGFNGVNIWNEKYVDGGAFCNYQYQYYLFMESKPGVEVLKKVYPTEGKEIGKDPVSGFTLHESLLNPETADLNQNAVDEWEKQISENNGIELKFVFSRKIKSDLTGCNSDYSYLQPYDKNRGNEELVMVYKSKQIEDSLDIRKADVEDAIATEPAVDFFRKIVKDIKK